MTSVTPRPMSTPDLAGILGKPRRRPVQQPPAVSQAPQDVVPVTDAMDEDQAPATAPPTKPVASSSRSPRPKVARQSDDSMAGGEPATAEVVPDDSRPDGASDAGNGVPRRYVRTISLYLPRSVYQRLLTEAEQRQMSRTALLLTSVNEVHELLPELLAEKPAPRGPLFDVPQARAAKEEPNTQTSMRVTDQQLTILEALAKQHNTTRSRVLAAAFVAYVA